MFRQDGGEGGGESDSCNRVDREIAQKMVMRVMGWMRHDRWIATEICGGGVCTQMLAMQASTEDLKSPPVSLQHADGKTSVMSREPEINAS